ncbi:hypothetical protein DERP_007324, partial [Dermatophagoides pteronyssinus]
KHHYKN